MITRVALEDWKSHHESHFDFSSGVNVLVGEMGSGKSSVLEAIAFGLFGTTPKLQSRRVTLDELIRRVPSPAETAAVEVSFTVDDSTYTVRREVKRDKGTDHAELRKEEELVEAPQPSEVTAEVENLLGVDYDVFARVIYAEQNQLDQFLEMRPGDRKERVDELLNLDRFETARKTLVKLIHTIEDRRDQTADTLEDMRESLAEADIETVKERVAEAEAELEDDRDALEEVEEKLHEQQLTVENLEEQQERYEELKEVKATLNGRIDTLQEQITERETALDDYADLDRDAIADRRDELEREREQMETRIEERDGIVQELSVLRDREERLQEERDELQEQVAKGEDLEEVVERLDEATERLDELKARKQEVQTRIDDISESLQHLSAAADTCPTCGQELTDDHRVEILQERKEEKDTLQDELEQVKREIGEKQDMVDDLQDRRDDLLQYQDAAEKLEEVQDDLDDLQDEIETKEERVDALDDDIDEERLDEIEDALDRLDDAEKLHEQREELAQKQDRLDRIDNQLDDLDFDPEQLETEQKRLNALERKETRLTTKIEGLEETLEERRGRLETLEEQQDRIDDLEAEIEAYRRKEQFLREFESALTEAQTALREEFVASVNEVMERVWERVYPYDDYTTIRLNAAEGYAVEVQDAEREWVSVEGEVSGGERHTAALTLRIALGIILSPAWRILILDEPTHNLDVTAIEDLAETLRTTVSDIVDQLFLITHEERLEISATGDLYKLSKKETESGLTEVEQVAVEE